MAKKKQYNINGLLSADITPMVDDMIASITKEKGIDPEKLERLFSSRKKVNEVYDLIEDQLTNLFLSHFTVENFRNEHGIAKKNSQTIVDMHEDMFHYFFAYLHTTHTVYKNFCGHMQSAGEEVSKLPVKDRINLILYGNLCRMADQIGVQLTNGYTDAALILWRTFYEYCVVAVFLLQRDSNRLASRFKAFSEKLEKRKVESYTKRQMDLKFPPLEETIVKRSFGSYKKVEKNYGKDFFQNDYSWAQPYLKGKANFLALEEAAGFGRFRPYYIWVSGKAHPTYSGITDFRDSSNATVLEYITLQETSRRAFVDPTQLTLAAFHQVNDHFLHRYSGHEHEVNMKMFRKIYDKFGEIISEEKVAMTDPVSRKNGKGT